MRDILSGARGMSPVVLVILIAWALLSVMFLTGTLLAARSIDRSVGIIKPTVDDIGTDARFIRQAKSIEATSAEIRKAAAPLSGHLAVTLETASKGIDPKLKSVLGTVGQINSVADDINGTVIQIGSKVDSIFASASSINDSVKSIGRKGDSILGSVREINASAKGILSSGGSILSRVNSIDRAVATIVGIATDADGTAKAIKQDFDGIDARVGEQGRGGRFGSNIVGHANSIDCAAPVSLGKLGSGGCK